MKLWMMSTMLSCCLAYSVSKISPWWNKKLSVEFKEYEVFLHTFLDYVFIIVVSMMCLTSTVISVTDWHNNGIEDKRQQVWNQNLKDEWFAMQFWGSTEPHSSSTRWWPFGQWCLLDTYLWFDHKFEKLFRDVGGWTSHMAFVKGYMNLIIDNEKLKNVVIKS